MCDMLHVQAGLSRESQLALVKEVEPRPLMPLCPGRGVGKGVRRHRLGEDEDGEDRRCLSVHPMDLEDVD